MRPSIKFAAAALALLLQACSTAPIAPATSAPPVAVEIKAPVTILISIDGFHPDYLKRGVTPNLAQLAATGATGPMRPSFPTKTFPNHWTLVTGLRPDRHGIVGNKMEDPARPGETFTMASDDPFWWNAADPIWVDARKAGIRVATQFWPGSNVQIGGIKAREWPNDISGGTRPDEWSQFNQAITGEQRVNGILDWLRRPARIRPAFLTLYLDTVDTISHRFGPADPRTTQSLAEVDKRIGELRSGLTELGQPANLVIVSDHGMAETRNTRVIFLSDFVSREDYRMIEDGPFAGITPIPGKEASVATALMGKHPHFECWRKSEIPARFHFGTNPRIAPIFCLADSGWEIEGKPSKKREVGGAHGYDNFHRDMLALFIANGPAFRAGTVPVFDNVDIYPLLRDLIGLPEKPGVDGTATVFAPLMTRPAKR